MTWPINTYQPLSHAVPVLTHSGFEFSNQRTWLLASSFMSSHLVAGCQHWTPRALKGRVIVFSLREIISLCGQGWSSSSDLSTLASQATGPKIHVIMPNYAVIYLNQINTGSKHGLTFSILSASISSIFHECSGSFGRAHEQVGPVYRNTCQSGCEHRCLSHTVWDWVLVLSLTYSSS